MLKPAVQVREVNKLLLAEFWDCLRLDPAPVQELRKKFDEHLRGKGRPILIVDFNGVGFAGSAALGGFIELHRLVRRHGGRLIFCNVDPTIREVFRVSRLEPLFTFAADVPEAIVMAEEAPQSGPDGATDASGAEPLSPPPKPFQRSGSSPLGSRRPRS